MIRLTALQSRVTEREWKVEADRIGPATITALLDALVTGIARIEEVTTPNVRMADFASMIVAAEQSLPWKEGVPFFVLMRITEGMWSTRSLAATSSP